MLHEPIKAKDIRVKYFSGIFPWEIEQDLNDWFEDADESTLVLDLAYHFSMGEGGISGPIWSLLTFTKKQRS